MTSVRASHSLDTRRVVNMGRTSAIADKILGTNRAGFTSQRLAPVAVINASRAVRIMTQALGTETGKHVLGSRPTEVLVWLSVLSRCRWTKTLSGFVWTRLRFALVYEYK